MLVGGGLAVYEVPYAVGEVAARGWREYVTQLDAALALDDRDAACLGDGEPPAEELARITQPTLVATGGVPDPHMGGLRPGYFDTAADAIASHVPGALRTTVAGQSHVADPATIAVVLKDFFIG